MTFYTYLSGQLCKMPKSFNPSGTKVFGTHNFYEGEVELTLNHDLENGRPYKLQLWQAIRSIYEKQKTDGVDDVSLVRFPWQLFCLRVFSTKLCYKRLKMTVFDTLFQLCASSSPTFLGQLDFFLTFQQFLVYRTRSTKSLASLGSF